MYARTVRDFQSPNAFLEELKIHGDIYPISLRNPSVIRTVVDKYKSFGIRGVLSACYHMIIPRRARCLSLVQGLLEGGKGLEIGGPSGSFSRSGILPLYRHIERLDNCTFSTETVWEGAISSGNNFQYDESKSPGFQYISEASNLNGIESASYDFVFSCHSLEHLANPILGLSEWLRVLVDDGILLLLLPHKDRTFDHKRPVTTLEHLIDDFNGGVEEDDMTHLEEILSMHDLEMDVEAGSLDEFAARSRKNHENRCLHQHVFDNDLVIELLSYMHLELLAIENVLPFHIIAVARKLPPGSRPDTGATPRKQWPGWV